MPLIDTLPKLTMWRSWEDRVARVRYVRGTEVRSWTLITTYAATTGVISTVERVNTQAPAGFPSREQARRALVVAYHKVYTVHAHTCDGTCFAAPERVLAGWAPRGMPYFICPLKEEGWEIRASGKFAHNNSLEHRAFRSIFATTVFPTRTAALNELVAWRTEYLEERLA